MAVAIAEAAMWEEETERYFNHILPVPNSASDVVEKIAAFFGVTVGELLNDTTKTARKPGPPSQFARLVERLEQLPRAKQKVVAEMLEGVLRQAS